MKRIISILILTSCFLVPRVQAVLPTPTNFRVTFKTDTRIFVDWEGIPPLNRIRYQLLLYPANASPSMYSWTQTGIYCSYYFYNLTPNTTYRIRLQAYDQYPNPDSSAVFDTLVTTEPTHVISQLPYHYGFEPEGYPFQSSPNHWLPNGWLLSWRSAEDFLVNLTRVNTPPDPEDPNVYELHTYSLESSMMITLPPLDTLANPMNTLTLRFSARPYFNRVLSFRVGLATDPYNISSFSALDTVNFDGRAPYKDVVIPLRSLPNNGNRIALLLNQLSNIYFDNFVIERNTNYLPPQNLVANQITETSVNLRWIEPSRPPLRYSVRLEPYDTVLPSLQFSVSGNNMVVSHLNPNTRYQAYVRSVYANDSVSEPARCAFHTHPLPCVDWDSSDHLFTLSSANAYESTQLPLSTSGYGNNFCRQLIFYHEIDSIGTLTGIDFYYLPTDTMTGFDTCAIFLGNTSENRLALINTDARKRVYTGPMSCTHGWNHFEFDSAFYYSGGNLFIDVWGSRLSNNPGTSQTFRTHAAAFSSCTNLTSSAITVDHYRNDMRLHYLQCREGDSCLRVAVSVVRDTTGDSRIAWNESFSDNRWDIYLQSPADSVPVLIDSAYTASNYTFSNLQDGSRYLITVVPYCDSTPNPSRAGTLEYLAPCPPLEFLPYTVDFDATSTVPTCYHLKGDASLTNSYAYFNRNAWPLKHPDGSDYTDSVHRSIRLDKGSIFMPKTSHNIRHLTLGITHYKARISNLLVGVVPDGDTLFQQVESIPIGNANHWNHAQVDFSSYNGPEGRIVIRNEDAYPVYIDSLTLDLIPYCGRPDADSITITNITGSSALIRWKPCPNAYSYTVEYGARDFAPGTGTQVASFADSVVLTGLDPATHYNFHIRAHCSNGDTSLWSFVRSFNTSCDAISRLPHFYDMSSWTTADRNPYTYFPCWSNFSISSPVFRNVIDSTGHQRSAMYLYRTGSYAGMFLLPTIDTSLISLSSTCLRFRVQTIGDASTSIAAGIYYSSSTPILSADTMDVSSTPQWFEVCFDNSANGNTVAISLSSNSSYLIDSISFISTPYCRIPAHIHTSDVTDTSATLTWDNTNIYSPYQLEYSIGGVTVIDTTTACSYHLSGLRPDTTYNIRLRAICDNGDTSNWRYCHITTLPQMARYPWCASFEDSADCRRWRTLPSHYPVINWYRLEEHGTSNHFYILSTNGDSASLLSSSQSYPAALYRDIDFGQADFAYRLSLRVRTLGNRASNNLRLFLAPTTYPTDNESTPWGTITQHSSLAAPRVTSQWQTYTFDLDTLQGIHRLVIYWSSTATSAPVAVDDVCLLMPLCFAPTGLTATATDTSAVIQWQGDDDVAYQLLFSPLDDPTQVDTFLTTTRTLSLGGLTPGTYYSVTVRCICDTERISPFTDTLVFNTHVCSDVQSARVGSPATSGISVRLPVHTAYPYSYTQQIYTAEEVGRSGEIRSIRFHYDSTHATAYKPRCRIYMGHTHQSQYNSTDERIDDDFTLVYYGDMPTRPGWNSLLLQTPYFYTDTDNLVLTVIDHSGRAFDSCFYSVTEAWRPTSISFFGSSPIDFQSSATQGLTMSYHNTVQFDICPQDGCARPFQRHPLVHPYHITFRWDRDSTALSYTIQYRNVDDSTWTSFTTTDTAYRLNIALPTANYLARVCKRCADGTSLWSYRYFTVPVWHCPPIDDFRIEALGNHNVSLAWTPAEANATFYVHVFNAVFDSIYTVTTSTPTIGGIEINLPYAVSVQAECPDSNAFSIWSDTLVFTLPACPNVNRAWVDELHDTYAVIDWEGYDGALGWIIAYGSQGVDLQYANIDTAYSHPHTLRGLEPECYYDFYVRTICDTGYVSENWSPRASFTTPVGISSPVGSGAFTLRPNPTRGTVQVVLPEEATGEVRIEVLDLMGRTQTIKQSNSSQTITLDLSALPAGTYFVRVSTSPGTSIQRLIKQ